MKNTMFAQTLQLLPWNNIQKCLDERSGDKHSKGLKTRDQLKAMLYCQLSGASSLSEICNGLKSYGGLVNHMGITHAPSSRHSPTPTSTGIGRFSRTPISAR